MRKKNIYLRLPFVLETTTEKSLSQRQGTISPVSVINSTANVFSSLTLLYTNNFDYF